jgi:serine/threonine-protein kinase
MDQPSKDFLDYAEPDLTGRQLGDYYVLRRLGQGAMAVVYLAEQGSLKRPVALKVLRPSLAQDETYVKRFQREAQAAAALIHANIVQIYEVGQANGTYYIAQEYVQGVNLRQWTSRNGAPDLRLALVVMRQVTAALAKAAEHGIVHRDIKPENVLLTRSGEVKVADFGLARFQRAAESVDLTQVGITVGSPLYMSPEQVEGRPLDSRSDLYSFGVTCYQMLAGCPPFSGETPLSVALQHLNKQPEPLENHRPDLPAALCRAVHKMLAKNPEHRFQTPQELLRELRRIYQAHLGDQSPEELSDWETAQIAIPGVRANETTQRLDALMKAAGSSRWGRRRWMLWAAAGAAAFLLGGTLGYVTTRGHSLLAGVANSQPPLPKYKTPFGQWLFASQVGTAAAWQSVIDYFPDQRTWVARAKQKLARIYLHEGEWEKALQVCDDLMDMVDEKLESEAWACGVIGKAWALARLDRLAESADVLQRHPRVLEIVVQDRDMRLMLQEMLKKTRSKSEPMSADEWQQFLELYGDPSLQPD